MAILHLALLSITVFEKFANLSSCLVNLIASLVIIEKGVQVKLAFHSMAAIYFQMQKLNIYIISVQIWFTLEELQD